MLLLPGSDAVSYRVQYTALCPTTRKKRGKKRVRVAHILGYLLVKALRTVIKNGCRKDLRKVALNINSEGTTHAARFGFAR